MKRTLYQCSHAKIGPEHPESIMCNGGHYLGPSFDHPGISLKRLIRGAELAIGVCQDCYDFKPSFDEGERPTPLKTDRGWTPNNYERNLVRLPKRNHHKGT